MSRERRDLDHALQAYRAAAVRDLGRAERVAALHEAARDALARAQAARAEQRPGGGRADLAQAHAVFARLCHAVRLDAGPEAVAFAQLYDGLARCVGPAARPTPGELASLVALVARLEAASE